MRTDLIENVKQLLQVLSLRVWRCNPISHNNGRLKNLPLIFLDSLCLLSYELKLVTILVRQSRCFFLILQRYGDFLLFSKFSCMILLSLYGQELDFRTNNGNGLQSCLKLKEGRESRDGSLIH